MPSPPLMQCLSPAELRVVESAYRTALNAVDESTTAAFSPLELRRVLARSVIEPALGGERDPSRMCEAALRRLRGLRSG
ncbi:hypothetical protein ACQKJ1_25280 [Methylorubrum rhodesianum]|uniref:hypothetical protein n=1 Tax=Methylorubrum rhodesianum TaxID=29427 RepID=UPI003D094B49